VRSFCALVAIGTLDELSHLAAEAALLRTIAPERAEDAAFFRRWSAHFLTALRERGR